MYLAFAKHWGFAPLPTRPRHPQENGKQERTGDLAHAEIVPMAGKSYRLRTRSKPAEESD